MRHGTPVASPNASRSLLNLGKGASTATVWQRFTQALRVTRPVVALHETRFRGPIEMVVHSLLQDAERIAAPGFPVLQEAIQVVEHVGRRRIREDATCPQRPGPPFHGAVEPADEPSFLERTNRDHDGVLI